MERISRFALLLLLASVPGFGASWSGALVDEDCYASLQGNTKHGTHPGSTDTNRPIRYCSPTEKTKSFSFVQPSGMTFNLDSKGTVKARELILKEGKRSPYRVHITG